MPATTLGERTLAESDHVRLSQLLPASLWPPALAELLTMADVISASAMPANVITMYSQVDIVDAHTGRRQTLTVCYPEDAEPSAGFISVLSPVGCGLLGQKAGSFARWPTPSGEEGMAEIVAIVAPPAAAGGKHR
ncbi:GreA/GreB family elongation factor [Polaromonas sp. SM01]|uniref:GreA/GreB family elongation factor n=1 Tax=Polaromonas sp. SM01 TaxID=3085630 RepID=UPI00298113B0|nr:GreA/GreB family elongation factor [Polaromonas sp. SM01]MDW5442746.1 GreA/GreB family elongation factor [Polaromonas sp. SM01]